MDPGGSIASVWPHPLPPASVPSFADNSTPNSSLPAPSLASHLSVSPLVLFSLFRRRETAFTTPIRIPQIPHTCTSSSTYERGLRRCARVRGFITGVARGDVCSRARDESVCVDVRARARNVTCIYVCTEGTRGRKRAAARGVTHFLAFHLFCLPTLFTPEPYFVNGPHAGR